MIRKHFPAAAALLPPLLLAGLSLAAGALAQVDPASGGPSATTGTPPATPYEPGKRPPGPLPEPRGGSGAMPIEDGTRDSGSSTVPGQAPEVATPPLFTRLDSNRDGRISREEARRSADTTARFTELDNDRDGFISASEWVAAEARGSGSGR